MTFEGRHLAAWRRLEFYRRLRALFEGAHPRDEPERAVALLALEPVGRVNVGRQGVVDRVLDYAFAWGGCAVRRKVVWTVRL